MSVELGGGEDDRVGDLGGVGKGLPGERRLAQQPPPALGRVQPARSYTQVLSVPRE
ncbi:hypothetical protein [Streptosporangium roseum]|uniref:hypothetical protein n=1 Tax=Streptosporangium roseum TaxID=2001 RepID=UPI0033185E6F